MKRPEDERLAITSSLIQLKAIEIKENLLSRWDADKIKISALGSFKASKTWACLTGNQMGYLSSGTSNKWSCKQKANTKAYIKLHSRTPARLKKKRTEFTMEQKLAILQELETINAQNKVNSQPAITVEQFCQKYSTSKSTIHRWKQQYKSGLLQQLAVTSSGYPNLKRVSAFKLHLMKYEM